MYEWSDKTRCPGCHKMTPTVLGLRMNRTAAGWDNFMSRERAQELARDGVCPWCGKRTTTPARTILGRLEPTLRSYARESL